LANFFPAKSQQMDKTMRRFALIAFALFTVFLASSVTNPAGARDLLRPGYKSAPGHRVHAMRMHKINRNKHSAAVMAAGVLGIASILDAVAHNARASDSRPAFAGDRYGGMIVAHNPDYPHLDGYANPCTFERVTDFYGRPTPRVVKVCR
jgi:hypothetical protein